MAWEAMTAGEVAAGAFWTADTASKIKGNFDYLYGQTALTTIVGIPNGSFETDSDSDGTPDNWTAGVYSGGSKSLETTGGIDYGKCMKFVHPGGASNGGGWVRTDYIPIGLLQQNKVLGFGYYSTAAGCKVIVEAEYFDIDQSSLGTLTLYSTTSNPTAWTQVNIQDMIVPDLTTRYAKFKFLMGYTDTDVAATLYLDDVRLLLTTPDVQGVQLSETINQTSAGVGGNAWADLGSTVSITVPSWAASMRVFHRVKAESAAGTTYARFRVDSTYSTSNVYAAAVADTFYQLTTPLICDVSALAGARTFSFQGKGVDESANRTFVESLSANQLKFYTYRVRTVSAAGGGAGGYFADA